MASLGVGIMLTVVVVLAAWLRRSRLVDWFPAGLGLAWTVSLCLLGLSSVAVARGGPGRGAWVLLVVASAMVLVVSQAWLATFLHRRWVHVLLDAWLVAVAVLVPVVAFAQLGLRHDVPSVLLVSVVALTWVAASTALLAPYAGLALVSTGGTVLFTATHAAAAGVLYLASPVVGSTTLGGAVLMLVLGYTSLAVVAISTRSTGSEAPRVDEVRHPDQAASLAVLAAAVVTTVLVALYVETLVVLPALLLCLTCVVVLVVRQMLISRQNERTAAHLSSRERYFRSLVQDSTDMLLICSAEGVVEYASQAVEEVLGLGTADTVGRPVGAILDLDPRRFAELSRRVMSSDDEAVVDVSTSSERGRLMLEATVSAQAGKVLLAIRDLTDRDRLREQLSYVASHDLPTDLLNRRGINHTLAGALRLRSGRPAVLFLDLDGFKRVNDAAGHDVGDRLLKAVAERLDDTIPSSCVLGRYGGDEFVVIVPDRDETDPQGLAERIVAAVKEPYIWSSHQFVIGASVGIALADVDSQADSIVRYADLAMYEAKKARSGYAFFEPRMLSAVKEQARADFALTEAFDAGRLHLLYQPIVDLVTGEVVKAEGLLRWTDLEGTEQRPLDLVEFMERSGRGQALSRWVIAEAVKQQVAWRAQGHHLQVTINLSPVEFTDPALIVFIDQVIEDYGIPEGSLELEVTERVMIQDPARAVLAMEALRVRGIQVAVDDFGTGFSSLRYLLDLPIDTLKLDRAFVTQVSSGAPARSIVQGIVTIGRELSLRVVAEGIEAEEQRRLMAEMGCDLGQGYLFSAELHAPELEAMLLGQSEAC
ncbi:putative bifunctional diguanylate cyclase/phosphodiesterase [Solicola sp. PLA-1-18]|uniref:putative bifunctional diguanylate cyclase/phosphodiesterase n=1 Tax=Solicola sp. PLA-1-18 TaxID=3380532 RepID=UPI003B7EC9E2